MDTFTIEKYIEMFDNQNTILIKSNNIVYKIVNENESPIAYFDNNEIVFRISEDLNFYALKCFSNGFDNKKTIYTKENLIDNNEIIEEEHEIEILNNSKLETTKVLLATWVDDISFNNCSTRYVKQLHNKTYNIVYKKRRSKTKFGVMTILIAFIIMITSVKFMYPNEIYINPIDYKKLIAADSLKTMNLAINKNKLHKDSLIQIESDANGKSIFIKENSNEVLSILIPEPVKVDKPKIIIPKVEKKIVPVSVKKNKVTKKEKEVNEEEIKIIHAKSRVNFKSTDF